MPRLRARHLHFAFDPRPCRPWTTILERLRSAGVATSWDFGWNPDLIGDRAFPGLVETLDYLFVNRDEARAYRARPSRGLTIVTLGADGCRAIGRGVDLRIRAPRVRAVDTTGAGDVFNGAFLASRLAGATLDRALRVAARDAARSTRHPGGLA